ncbi:MAG: hypothetical protein VW230_05840 [Candidatus Poseidoniales archaeon]|jgi:flagellin-like protein
MEAKFTHQVSASYSRDEKAVSEVLGVVMLLAMVITIMGGVWIFLNPYMSDFEDNTNWKSATGITERIDDRISVAGNSPNGTGFKNSMSLISTSVQTMKGIEYWTVAADLSTRDVIQVRHLNDSTIEISSYNERVSSVEIQNHETLQTIDVEDGEDEYRIRHNLSRQKWIMITAYDVHGNALHRHVDVILSGLKVTTSLGMGEHQMALINNAIIERFPNEPWTISTMPSLSFTHLANGDVRLAILLTDAHAVKSFGGAGKTSIEFVSLGPLNLFSGPAYNIQFSAHSELHPVVSPQYHETWLQDYYIHRSSATLTAYDGIAPFERASGADGFTVMTTSDVVHFEVDLQRVEVSS